METPKKYDSISAQPLSGRKKSLFARCSARSESIDEIGPMSPLQFSSSPMRLSSGLKHYNNDEEGKEIQLILVLKFLFFFSFRRSGKYF